MDFKCTKLNTFIAADLKALRIVQVFLQHPTKAQNIILLTGEINLHPLPPIQHKSRYRISFSDEIKLRLFFCLGCTVFSTSVASLALALVNEMLTDNQYSHGMVHFEVLNISTRLCEPKLHMPAER